ncbi:glucan 1,4-alpha-glucosidase [Fulvivirga sp. M361]|uniref:glucan 1,4-alpha-glucosidase n=1 Tax=Fulvivirga sp. M361 TaxID=2594266 RepID=UPI00117ABC19|nr:glucan 1,4-alpha-glucosidase [Fulvivirga sp. M361]TRX48401.1 glucan 1,4-alpha-glucosidase [Fulvivirga sp. M361]
MYLIKSKFHYFQISLLLLSAISISNCGPSPEDRSVAPGSPGASSYWNYAGKTGIGTSYERYWNRIYDHQGETGNISKVWFSLAKGVITETAFGMIHEAQIKDIQFIIKGADFIDIESSDTHQEVAYLHTDDEGRPLSLAYKLINTDKEGKYSIEKHVFTDPDEHTLFLRVIFKAMDADITPYLLVNPHMNNTGSGDKGFIDSEGLHASENDRVYLTLKNSVEFTQTSVGFKDRSCGYADLADLKMDWNYSSTGDATGNVILTGQWAPVIKGSEQIIDISVGFGNTLQQANASSEASMEKGYKEVLNHYNGTGDQNIGWEDYLQSLPNLKNLIKSTGDGGKQLYASALVLKAQEDKENAGALIASLSIPWGDSASAETSKTGYRAVWPRDFYQCAMAFLALGDTQTAQAAFEYLPKIQVTEKTPDNDGATGWFLQKTKVDGTLEWYNVQMDQTAMPIMLGWKLWKAGTLSDEEITQWYEKMLKPAADFLSEGGKVSIRDNEVDILPPFTQQERWEEQYGYSPSTTAAIITGLVTAADIAKVAGDHISSEKYFKAADLFESEIEKYMFTTTGTQGNGKYFIRITRNTDPNDHAVLGKNNGRPGMDETTILDGGFLELVRYGLRSPHDPYILETLPEYDNMDTNEITQVKYEFQYDEDKKSAYPGWRRYGNDGYGEDTTDGSNYGRFGPGQRGRVWPFFTGERGHYELAKLTDTSNNLVQEEQLHPVIETYVKGMEHFANEGLMLPEQIWDGIGNNQTHHYQVGEGTSSATPLAWTHAEYIKLVRSVSDQSVWDFYPPVNKRYVK